MKKMSPEEIYEIIRNRILLLHYAPETYLDLQKLAEEFLVSFTPIRGVLIRLQAEGFVNQIRQSRPTISSVSWDKLYKAYEIRQHLTKLLGKLVIERATQNDIQSLKHVIGELKTCTTDLDSLILLDDKVHEVINSFAQNEVLSKALELSRHWMVRCRGLESSVDETAQSLICSFSSMLDAIEKKDVALLNQVMKDHTDNLMVQMKARIETVRRSAQLNGTVV